ncbi:GNAT family N-acetyltransferase [Cryobacterium sp. TMT1-66-1]|uniref:GNAT family N-acetyltransferase n=1 Tax=Cryobacterium sp. TMT1-66-1 TaxID=1259242 RepID=UPI00106BD716|nr:GNAT family protein [Cryobacterium sp. TMT1-66-1]TFD09889.1 N-acetyltransferase [Cryobacterium sp. TMT1-66-1]
MNAVRPHSLTLTGRFVQLQPLGSAVLPDLARAIAHPEVFAAGYGGGPATLHRDVDSFIKWAHDYFQWESLPYVVRLLGGPNDGDVVGTTTLADIDEVNESIHLGWTAYDPRVWGTAVNAETKLLVLGTAFENGFGRVKIQADAINERSRAAILGIGATFEGILRRDRPRADGTWRDSAVYSILANEWPAVRAGLEARLDAFEGRFVTYRSLRPAGPSGTISGGGPRGGFGPSAGSAPEAVSGAAGPVPESGSDAEQSAGADTSQ